jgi:peptidoglycan/LPS O-acetylase OafA/YrhL
MSMTKVLSEEKTLSLRDNSFDLLRLLLAGSVVYSHSYAVGGFGSEPLFVWSKEGIILGHLGVLGFFGLSGFLVSASFARSSSPFSYLLKRVRRIFPGFWVCLLVTGFVIAPLIWASGGRELSLFPWMGDNSATSYFIGNFFLLVKAHSVGMVLNDAAWPASLNGSLWSLFPEFLCYLAVLILGLGGALATSRWLAASAAVAVLGYYCLVAIQGSAAFPNVPATFAYSKWAPYLAAFFVGICAQLWKDKVRFNGRTVFVLVVITVFLLKLGGFKMASPVLVTAFVLCLGSLFTCRLQTDLSYGIYIYSFPCQQLLFSLGIATAGFPIYFLASLLTSAGCAWLSWSFVEKPALGWRQERRSQAKGRSSEAAVGGGKVGK